MIAHFLRIIVGFVLMLWPRELAAQEGSEGQRLYEAFMERGRGETELFIRKLKPAERQAVINYVRYLQTLDTAGKDYDNDTLFFMGDPAVRKQFLDELRKFPGDTISAVVLSGDPTIIEEIAPSIFVEEPMRNVGGEDTPMAPTSFRVANVITFILKNSPDFTDEVRKWADKQSVISQGPGDGGVEFREVMRQWWRANEQFFREKNYRAVQPGRDWLQDIRDRGAAVEAAYNAAQAKAAAATRTPPPPSADLERSPPFSPAPSAVDPPTPPSQTPWLGLVITGALALLLAAALYLSNRPRA